MFEAAPSPDLVERIAAIVREHEQRRPLSALAYTVLSRQAEGRSLFAGKKYMRQQAREHGVKRSLAETEAGNLLRILEKGPAEVSEFALVGAFAVAGFEQALQAADDRAGRELAARFAGQLAWLDLASSYRLQPFVPILLAPETLEVLARAICEALLADQAAAEAGDPAARARTVTRLTMLMKLEGDTVAELLARIGEEASDPLTRRLVAPRSGAASSQTPSAPPRSGPASGPPPSRRPSGSTPAGVHAQVQARVAHPPAGPALGTLRLLSGWALAAWILRMLGLIVGVRRSGSFSLEPAGVRVATETRAAGRVWAALDQVVRLEEVRFGRRHVRYPALRRLVGLLAFCLGSLMGALILYDGAAIMESTLIGLGAGLIGIGCLLDLVFDVLLAGARKQVSLELGIGRRRYCLRGVPMEQADEFMDALARCAQ